MSGSYSLRNANRLVPPSPYMLTSAVNRERDLTALMNQPGANQMIGYRYAAEADRRAAETEYNLGLEQHNAAVAARDEEDRRLMAEDRATQRRYALRNAVLSQPMNAALLAESDEEIGALIPQSLRDLARQYRLSEVARNNRLAAGGGGDDDDRAMDRTLAAGLQQEMFRADAAARAVEAEVTRAINAQAATIARMQQSAGFEDRQSGALEQQINKFRDESNARIAELRAQAQAAAQHAAAVRAPLAELRQRRNIPSGQQQPQRAPGVPPMLGSTPPADATPPAAQPPSGDMNILPNGAPLPALQRQGLPPEQQETRLRQAREAIAAGRSRAAVEQMLRDMGIDPSRL